MNGGANLSTCYEEMMNFPVFAAESDVGIGWALVLIAFLMGRYGWVLAVMLLIGVGFVRRTKSPVVGFFIAVALPVSLVLFAISAFFLCLR